MGVANSMLQVQFAPTNPLMTWATDGQVGVQRGAGVEPGTVPALLSELQTLALGESNAGYPLFRQDMEEDPHGLAHTSHSGGWIRFPGTAAKDPLFFLLHCNVDRLWAKWQWIFVRFDPDVPASFGGGSDRPGQRLADLMWPWAGPATEPGRPTTAPGGSLELSPMTPAPGPSPRVSDMIDYLGILSKESLVFAYDDVPFQAASGANPGPAPSGGLPMREPVDIERLRRSYLAEIPAAPPSRARMGQMRTVSGSAEADAQLVHAADIPDFDTAVRAEIEVLGDAEASTESRLAALNSLAAASFRPRAFAPFHPDFVEALRAAAVSKDRAVRTAALDQLTLIDDPEAARLLRASLERPRNLLVPDALAVQFLARNDHGDAAPLFRDLARTGGPRVREAAVRALASDTESTELLAELSADKNETRRMRETAALSLKELAPERFAEVAREVLLDDDDDDRLRAVAMFAIANTEPVQDALDTVELSRQLHEVERRTSSRTLKQGIQRFSREMPPGSS